MRKSLILVGKTAFFVLIIALLVGSVSAYENLSTTPSDYNILDTFNRADSAIVGTADTGQTWVEGSTSNAQILNNGLKSGSTGNSWSTNANQQVRINATNTLPPTITWLLEGVMVDSVGGGVGDRYNYEMCYNPPTCNDLCVVQMNEGNFYYRVNDAAYTDTGQNYDTTHEYNITIEFNKSADKCRYMINGSDGVAYTTAWVLDNDLMTSSRESNFHIWNGDVWNNMTAFRLWNGSRDDYPKRNYTNTFDVFVKDLYDDAAEQNVNVTFYNGSTIVYSALTDSSGNVHLSTPIKYSSFNFSANKTGFYNTTGNVVANSSNTSYIYQGVFNVTSVTTVITNASVSKPYNCTNGGKSYENCTNIYVEAGDNNIYWNKSGWYLTSYNLSVSAYDVGTFNYTGVFNSLLKINATNAYTNNSIANFSINASNSTYSWNEKIITTNGTVYFPIMQGLPLYLLFDAEGYSYANTTINATNATPHYTFNVLANNSLLINIFDEDSGDRIYENITVILSGNSSEDTYYTVTSQLFLANITDGNYTVKLQGASYTLKTYIITLADKSSQLLNAYLSSSTNTVTFTAKNSLSSETVEGVSVGVYKLINGSLTLVESKTTDITGRAQIVYSVGVKYSFVFSKSGYDDKAFSLDPILFSTYDVYLDPIVTETQSYGDVKFYYTPNTFYDNTSGLNNSFVFTINSPNGVLTGYSVNLTWPNGGSKTFSGANANGGSFNYDFNIYNSSITDVVMVYIGYQTVFGDNHQYSYPNGIIGDYGGTIMENRVVNTYGLGLFERVLIATFFALIFAGIAAIVAGKSFGLGVGMVALGIMAYIGFVPWLMVLLSILIGFAVLIRVGGE